MIGPHAEADPAVLLVSFLVMPGSATGPEPALVTGADRHPARLYALIAGDSSSGRKGTAGSEIERIFARADPAWHQDRIERGIQSAEALVARAGDSDDPRLLLVETEFGRLLAATARRPNLASVIKDAWAGRPLRTTTKDPSASRRADGAHIAILGHITPAELADRLTATDTYSGFANRFLYAAVRRSKLLPRGGSLAETDVDLLAAKSAAAITAARGYAARHGPDLGLPRTEAYWELWEQLYCGELQHRPPGLAGIVTSRAAPILQRLALAYALADASPHVSASHLQAARALWTYSQASATAIFGTITGSRDADRVLRALADGPLTRTGIAALFHRNKTARQLDQIITAITDTGHVRHHRQATTGRPSDTYHLIQPGTAAGDDPGPQ